MSILPIRISLRDKPLGKHRQDDGIDLLQCKLIGKQQYIKGLHVQLDDQERRHEETIGRIEARHAEIVEGLERELQEARERLAIACKAETAVTKTQELSVDEIRRHCTQRVMPLHESPLANPAHVPAWAVHD